MEVDYWWDILKPGAVLVRMETLNGFAVFQQDGTEITVDLFDDTATIKEISNA